MCKNSQWIISLWTTCLQSHLYFFSSSRIWGRNPSYWKPSFLWLGAASYSLPTPCISCLSFLLPLNKSILRSLFFFNNAVPLKTKKHLQRSCAWDFDFLLLYSLFWSSLHRPYLICTTHWWAPAIPLKSLKMLSWENILILTQWDSKLWTSWPLYSYKRHTWSFISFLA